VDGVTLTEALALNNTEMQSADNQIASWSNDNFMNINVKKTTALLMGPSHQIIAAIHQFCSSTDASSVSHRTNCWVSQSSII
jgi:hypothetical protein